MCDCYTGECEGCKVKIPIHIGDFSQSRQNVRVWCPQCHVAFLERLWARDQEWVVFVDVREAGAFIFAVERPRSIAVNE